MLVALLVYNYPNCQKPAMQGNMFVVLFKNKNLRDYVFHFNLIATGQNAAGAIVLYYANGSLPKKW